MDAVRQWEKDNPGWATDENKTQQLMTMIHETSTNINEEDESNIINKIVKKVEV